MEDSIKNILDGKQVPIDLNVDHDNIEALKTPPVTKRNVCYICATVLFDDKDRVLLVQEAKQSCKGQWYLPAGRLEPRETIVDGAKREVKEESGLECDLTSLVCVEINGTWIRFTFVGKITGGKLKTLEEKDSESLQAQFFYQDQLPEHIRPTKQQSQGSDPDSQAATKCVLRSKDILTLISLARKYQKEKSYKCLPTIHPHNFISHRFVIIDRSSESMPMHFLVLNKGGKSQLPFMAVNVKKNVQVYPMIASILNDAFAMSRSECSFQGYGMLSVEHRGTGKEEDGLCITHLVSLNVPDGQDLPESLTTEYSWQAVSDPSLQSRLNAAGALKNIVPVL